MTAAAILVGLVVGFLIGVLIDDGYPPSGGGYPGPCGALGRLPSGGSAVRPQAPPPRLSEAPPPLRPTR